ncbi:MAG: PAS domain S-box protein [Candidatus Electrothrix sp. GM3_4]|nr:PAS domain S-box protein [Candidatus Electrothrix sp. GM3_4]
MNTRTERRAYLEGFSVGVLRIGQVLQKTLFTETLDWMNIYLYDESSEQTDQPLYVMTGGNLRSVPDKNQIESYFHWATSFEVGGRQWKLILAPSSAYKKSRRSVQSWIVLIVSLLFSLVFILYLLKSFSYTEKLERHQGQLKNLVRQRTADLHTVNKELEQEIIERNQAGVMLKKSEARIRAVVDNLIDGIISITEKGTIEFFNPAAESIFGFQADEVIGKKVNMLMPEPHHSLHDTYLDNYKKTGKAQIIGSGREVPGRRKDGSIFPMDLSVNLMDMDEQRMFTAIIRDISERKAIEQELRQNTYSLAERVKELNCLYGVSSLIEESKNVEEIFSRTVELLPPSWRYPEITCGQVEVNGKIYQTDNFKETKWQQVQDIFVYKKKVGTIKVAYLKRVTEMCEGPFLPEEQNLINALAERLGHVLERNQAREEMLSAKEAAEAANLAKSEFLANMSHEIRTPMNAVLGFSDILASLIVDKQQKNYLDSIRIAGRGLLTLINDILDLSKIEAGRLELHCEYIDLRKICYEIEQIFAQKTSEKQLNFIVEIAPDLPLALLSDETRIKQILLNLVGNAVKFTAKGEIKLTVRLIQKNDRQGGDDLLISVQDTGIGIKENQQDVIFESFRQQDGQHTRKYEGTGLGLTITKRLVKMMNGDIILQSAAGKGSEFTVILHEIKSDALRVENSFPEDNVDPPRKKFQASRVMVVDDTEVNRQLFRLFLDGSGLEVIEAESGEQALVLVEKFPPRIIFMDIKMPGMDGYETLRRLKEKTTAKKISVIAFTAFKSVEEKARIEKFGFDGCLFKPVDRRSIFTELTRFIPCSETEPDTLPPEEVQDMTLSDIDRLPELVLRLNGEMTEMWQGLKGAIEMDAAEDFAQGLAALAQEYDAQELRSYAENLLSAVRHFEINGIQKILGDFETLLNTIQGMKK